MIIIGDVYIRLVDLPFRVKGFSCKDASGNYNVYINSRLSIDAQKEAYTHELKHVIGCDFERCNAGEIELDIRGL